MLRDVPYCKSILACGAGGLILSLFFLTWVYPAFCSKVSQVKETKVREYMEDRYGISDHSASVLTSVSHDEEISKGINSEASATAIPMGGMNGAADTPYKAVDDGTLPPAKRH